ncbi:hypothetical protein [Breoghania sp. L-A4]|uniref:hypothetical protein n=1 Tax=Breoghania sp. L-A4 TaxID=2304600 RepID=UPI000E35D135|nr:hypothetical protein [Breoghania sp. L-A4]AXS41392.1 hypothetical protein D1F64_16950 [Breoghania sp. L-A4]
MLTVQLAREFLNTRIIVNAVSPGLVKAGYAGSMTPEQGARLPVHSALLSKDAVSDFFASPVVNRPGKLALRRHCRTRRVPYLPR